VEAVEVEAVEALVQDKCYSKQPESDFFKKGGGELRRCVQSNTCSFNLNSFYI